MSPRTTSSPPATKIDLDAVDRGSPTVTAARSAHPKLAAARLGLSSYTATSMIRIWMRRR
jgi:hypothetical protein